MARPCSTPAPRGGSGSAPRTRSGSTRWNRDRLADSLAILTRESSVAGLQPAAAALRLNAEPAQIEAAFDAKRMVRAKDGRYLAREEWSSALGRVLDAVRSYAEEHRLRHGAPKGEIKSRLLGAVEGVVFDEALETLVTEGTLVVSGDPASAFPTAGPRSRPSSRGRSTAWKQSWAGRDFRCPISRRPSARSPAGLNSGELVRHMVEAGRAVRVTSEILYPQSLWAEIEKRVRAHFTQRPSLTMAEFKDLLQVSRKYAVPVLEHLDRTGLTRREGDARAPGPKAKP